MRYDFRFLCQILLVCGVVAGGLSGCEEDEIKGCGPVDQRDAFLLPADVSEPLKVTVDFRFEAGQKREIFSALEVWNLLGRAQIGRDFMTPEEGIPQSLSVEPDDLEKDECERLKGSAESLSIVAVTDEAIWDDLGLQENNPAVTLRCYKSGSLEKQVVLVHTRYTHPTQLKSVVLHEVGHALGLNHSCRYAPAATGYATCNGMGSDHPYHQAVMFPVLSLGTQSPDPLGNQLSTPETKELLRANDEERMACLYSK